MLKIIKAELESLDKAMEACGELAIRLERLANALEGEQKQEATRLGDAADRLADGLLGISVNLERSIAHLDEPSGNDQTTDPQ